VVVAVVVVVVVVVCRLARHSSATHPLKSELHVQ